MTSDLASLLTILGMAIVTYATRAGGIWLLRRTTPSPAIRAWLDHVPGAILISIIAPLTLFGGFVPVVGAIITVFVMLRTRHFILASGAGVLVVWALRAWG